MVRPEMLVPALSEEDQLFLDRVDGMFVTMLHPAELEQWARLVREGVAEVDTSVPGLPACRQVRLPLRRE